MGLILLMKQYSKLSKLAKCCEDRDQPWTKVLPVALLTYMHMRKHIRVTLSPFEILFEALPFLRGVPAHSYPPPASKPHNLQAGDWVVV